jgi:uncharacterized protein YdiU (UPF0061 family)
MDGYGSVMPNIFRYNDFFEFHRLVEVLSNPYENQADTEKYAVPPRPEQIVRATFCGT